MQRSKRDSVVVVVVVRVVVTRVVVVRVVVPGLVVSLVVVPVEVEIAVVVVESVKWPGPGGQALWGGSGGCGSKQIREMEGK